MRKAYRWLVCILVFSVLFGLISNFGVSSASAAVVFTPTPTPTMSILIIPMFILPTATPTTVTRFVPSDTPPPPPPVEAAPSADAVAVSVEAAAPVPSAAPTSTPTVAPLPAVVAPPMQSEPAVYEPTFFKASIQGPFALVMGQLTCLTNLLLALILALAFGFFGNLLNNTLESNETKVARLFAPLLRWLQYGRDLLAKLGAGMIGRPGRAIGFALRLILLLLLSGAVLAYLDPQFQIDEPGGPALIAALAASIALIALLDDLVLYLILRRRGGSADLRLHGGNFVLVLISTFFSRLFGLAPGLLIGSPAGLENAEHDLPDVWVDLLGLGVTGLTALIAWFASTLAQGSVWLTTVLLLIFAAGVQSLFFEMMPVGYLHGRNIFRASPLVWFGLFAGVSFLFLHTMINPNGDFIQAFNSPNMVTLAVMVAGFCLFSTVLWILFRRKDVSFAPEAEPPA